jgi:hypothetical protein
MAQSVDVDLSVIRAIDAYVKQLHPGFVPTQSHMSRTLWRFLDRTILPSEHIEAKVMEFLRKGILTKRQTVNGQMQELVTTELNPNHPLIQQALPGYRNDAYDGLPVEEGEYEEDEYEDAYDDEYEDDEYEDGDEELEEDNVGNVISDQARVRAVHQ